MSEGINLISNNSASLEREQKILKILKITALSLLILIAVVSISVFILNMSVPIADIKRQQSETLNQIKDINTKLGKHLLVKDRIANISTIISARKDYNDSINKIIGILPQDVNLSKFDLKSDALVIDFSAKSLDGVNTLLNKLVDFQQNKQVLSNIYIQSIGFDPKSGAYSINITANIL